MEIRRELEGEKGGVEEERLMIREIKWKGERWKIGTICIRKKLRKVLERIKTEAEEKKRKKG